MNVKRLLICLLAPLAFVLATPGDALAATCSDHSNQASAQRAKDTRDADGDGIYCEALPCPCAGSSPPPALNLHNDKARERAAAKRRAAARARRRRAAERRRRRLEEQRRRTIEGAAYVIVDVIDGDTVVVEDTGTGDRRTVRLIGIDAPETVDPDEPVECGGREAVSLVLQSTFPAPVDTNADGLFDEPGGEGATVELTTDRSQTIKDRYGRTLAYVDVVTPDLTFDLGGQVITGGLADRYVFSKRFARYGRYGQLLTAARSSGAGVHGACDGDFHRPL